ncbi:Cof-type HAD-IIB family hydrolase [Tissierella creatinini]|nr:Cof-type HAD-IIB family hydrolase [Tissierella creatinini]TJX63802.1 Cof-type HAD-IIB family hydrolase [Soehngenia saccharolytica]
MFKLIALDLDGTLLNDQKTIPNDNLDFIKNAILAGYEIVIATGRRYYSAKELTSKIPNEMTILANNGNIIRNSVNDKLILNKFIDKDDAIRVIKLGKSLNLNPIVHVDYYEDGVDILVEKETCEGEYSSFFRDINRYKIISAEDLLNQDRVLAIVYPGVKSRLVDFYKKLNDNYPQAYNSHILDNIQMTEALLEIMNPLGSKWKSLVEYADSKGIKAGEIIAVGDDNNDLEMILNAGLGISMKNGSKLMLEAADLITERDNNNSGVAYELRKVLGLY